MTDPRIVAVQLSVWQAHPDAELIPLVTCQDDVTDLVCAVVHGAGPLRSILGTGATPDLAWREAEARVLAEAGPENAMSAK